MIPFRATRNSTKRRDPDACNGGWIKGEALRAIVETRTVRGRGFHKVVVNEIPNLYRSRPLAEKRADQLVERM